MRREFACQIWTLGITLAGALAAACLTGCSGRAASPAPVSLEVAPIERRPLVLPTAGTVSQTHGGWGGAGICYGPHRDGQAPGGASPTIEQIREDLHILARHFSILRMYAARGSAELACRVIREDKLPLRMMVGAWIGQEVKVEKDGKRTEFAAVAADNAADVNMAIKLANDYPDVVMAINIANESLVEWSEHRVPNSVIIGYLKQARAGTKVPITTCDTEMFWTRTESTEVANECDFIGLHAYAMWNKQQIPESLTWTRNQIDAVRKLHPGVTIALCETGWATKKGTAGYQAIGIVAQPGEREQEVFFRSFRDYAVEAKLPFFYFQAFDERWKGGTEPDEVEKHWGLYNPDRTPKLVFRDFVPPAKTTK